MELVILLVILFAYNIIINKYLPKKYHLVFALSLSVALVWWRVAQSDIPLGEIGLALNPTPKGLIYGTVAYIIISLTIALGVIVPFVRNFFDDSRVSSFSVRQLLYKALINIPIGTVFLEEIVFRGVMLVLLVQQTTTMSAMIISSAFFGIWHILPAMTSLTTNNQFRKIRYASFIVIIGTISATFLTGIGLCFLRILSGSLVAPLMAHYAINSGSLIASWWIHKFHKQ